MSANTTPVKYGEPWSFSECGSWLFDKDGNTIAERPEPVIDRALQCVNACIGIDDPVEMRRVYDAHRQRQLEQDWLAETGRKLTQACGELLTREHA